MVRFYSRTPIFSNFTATAAQIGVRAVGLLSCVLGGIWLAGRFPHHPVLQYLLNPIVGSVTYGRDQTMARNIDIQLSFINDNRIFRASMGLGHSRGVGHHLQAKYGFREVALPPPSAVRLTPAIAVLSTRLIGTPPADPMGRILIATAKAHNCPLISKDRRIRDYPHVESVW